MKSSTRPNPEIRTWEQLVSLAALSVIVAGAAYAYNREHIRSNLQRWYDEDNRTYFAGQLPPVVIFQDDLAKDDADGETRLSDHFDVIIDRSIRSEQTARAVLHHEECHLAVWGAEEHGQEWTACMESFPQPTR